MIKVFLDANVILEVLMKRSDVLSSAAILRAGEEQEITLFTSTSVIGCIAYWMIKDWGLGKTKSTLLDLLSFIRCIDISHDRIVQSLRDDFKDIEDGMQYYAALEHQIDYFATLDKKGFRKAKGFSRVVTPQQLIKVISA